MATDAWARWQWRKSVRRQRRLWVVPVAYSAAAVALALAIAWLEGKYVPAAAALVSTDSARDFLSATASGMFAFTGIVFSMAFLLVQFGSTAYSPRLAGWFFADRIVRHALGIFSATVVFSLLSLLLTDRGSSGSVPFVSLLVALSAVLLSILAFFALIQRITHLQISRVLQRVGDRGREVIDDMYEELAVGLPTSLGQDADGAEAAVDRGEPAPSRVPDTPAESGGPRSSVRLEPPAIRQALLYRGGPAALVAVDFGRLVRMAARAGAIIEVEYGVGDTVPDGATVLVVRGGRRNLSERLLRSAFTMGGERTIEQDPKYAIRLIADIAVKALSPALNDPTTAIQALDQLDDLLRRLGCLDLDIGRMRDRRGAVRVMYPAPTWDDFLALAFDEIRLYGASSMQVARRLGALLADLEGVVPPDRRPAVRHHAERVRASVMRSFQDETDREEALVVDRQGLGLGREADD